MLILCFATLLNLLISSKSFLVMSLGYSIYEIISSVNSENFSSLEVWIPLILFSCIIALARISTTTLNRSGKNGYPCF